MVSWRHQFLLPSWVIVCKIFWKSAKNWGGLVLKSAVLVGCSCCKNSNESNIHYLQETFWTTTIFCILVSEISKIHITSSTLNYLPPFSSFIAHCLLLLRIFVVFGKIYKWQRRESEKSLVSCFVSPPKIGIYSPKFELRVELHTLHCGQKRLESAAEF